MKKAVIYLLMISFICVCTTACTNQHKQKQSMVQSKRRFAQYLESQEQGNPNAIDLSEGPKQNYNAKFGPKNLEFDVKIVDPY
jgi:hypothetical protein